VKKTVRTFRKEMLTCLRSGAPSLSILGKNVLFLAKFMQPANFFFGTFFFFREKKKGTRGIGGKAPRTGSGAVAPKKRRSPGKAFPEKGSGGSAPEKKPSG
jgi:hypothetical protein